MSSDSLHCTAHVSEGPDDTFEEVWKRNSSEVERLSLSCIFWTKDTADVSVSLSQSRDELFDDVFPHVLLAKPANLEWKDLRLWIGKQLSLPDFSPADWDPRTLYSQSGDV